jgi:hypothetical protein
MASETGEKNAWEAFLAVQGMVRKVFLLGGFNQNVLSASGLDYRC